MTDTSLHRVTGGVIVVTIGLLLLGSTTNALPVESVWSWIPLVFVLLGLYSLVASRGRNLVGPVMVVAIAGTVQLRELSIVTDGQIARWWPLFVVLFGVLLVIGRYPHRGPERVPRGDLSMVTLFGEGIRRVTGDVRGGEIVTVFGSSEIDLRDATVADPPAHVDAMSIFGGVELRVPEDWTVHVEVLTLFGSSEDARARTGGGEPTLVVSGLTIFGGVEVLD
ncbi:MAG: LiaI-LiaF-like domain-containing protein [Halanaeroarchaeum sp.]